MNDRREDSTDDAATLAARIVLDVLRERGELDLVEGRAGREGGAANRDATEAASPDRPPAAPAGDLDDQLDQDDPRAIARAIVERARAEHGLFDTRGDGAWPAVDGAGRDAGEDELRGPGPGVRTGAGAVAPPMAYHARLVGDDPPLVLLFGDPVDPAGRRWPEVGAGAAAGAGGWGAQVRLADRVDQALAPLLAPSPIDLVAAVVGTGGRAVGAGLARSRWVIAAVLAGIAFVVTFRLGMAALQDVVDLRLEIDPPATSPNRPPDATPVPPG